MDFQPVSQWSFKYNCVWGVEIQGVTQKPWVGTMVLQAKSLQCNIQRDPASQVLTLHVHDAGSEGLLPVARCLPCLPFRTATYPIKKTHFPRLLCSQSGHVTWFKVRRDKLG